MKQQWPARRTVSGLLRYAAAFSVGLVLAHAFLSQTWSDAVEPALVVGVVPAVVGDLITHALAWFQESQR